MSEVHWRTYESWSILFVVENLLTFGMHHAYRYCKTWIKILCIQLEVAMAIKSRKTNNEKCNETLQTKKFRKRKKYSRFRKKIVHKKSLQFQVFGKFFRKNENTRKIFSSRLFRFVIFFRSVSIAIST